MVSTNFMINRIHMTLFSAVTVPAWCLVGWESLELEAARGVGDTIHATDLNSIV